MDNKQARKVSELADANARTAGELLAAVDSAPVVGRENFPADSASSSPVKKEARLEDPHKTVGDRADDAMQGMKDSSMQAAEGVKQVASQATETVQAGANRTAEQIGEASSQVAEGTHGVIADVRSAATNIWNSLRSGGASPRAACVPSHPLDAYAPVKAGNSTYEPDIVDKHISHGVARVADTVANLGNTVAVKAGEAGEVIQNKAADASDAFNSAKDSAGHAAQDFAGGVQQKASDAVEAVKGATNQAGEQVGEVGTAVQNTAADAQDVAVRTKDQAGQKVDDAMQAAKDTAAAIKERTERNHAFAGRSSAVEAVQQTAEQVNSSIQDHAASAKDTVVGAAERTGEVLGHAGEVIQQTAAGAKDAVVDVKDRTGEALGEAGTVVQNTVADAQDAVVSTAHSTVQGAREFGEGVADGGRAVVRMGAEVVGGAAGVVTGTALGLGEVLGSVLGWTTHKTAGALESVSDMVTPTGVDVGSGTKTNASAHGSGRHQETAADVMGRMDDREQATMMGASDALRNTDALSAHKEVQPEPLIPRQDAADQIPVDMTSSSSEMLGSK